jgi:hypothetical protein
MPNRGRFGAVKATAVLDIRELPIFAAPGLNRYLAHKWPVVLIGAEIGP